MTTKDILEMRLWNEQLTQPTMQTAAEVVKWFGAMQSQDFAAAKWVVGQRMLQGTDKIIEDAFNSGEILRTHAMRPTWHFVHPEDIRWILKLSAPQIKRLMNYYNRILGLDEALFKKTQDIFIKALQGGKQMTRIQLYKELQKENITVNGQALGHIAMWAELDAVICSGPRMGKQFTYMLLEERAPRRKTAPGFAREEALFELTKRYFQSHGPATAKDFAWWSGLTIVDVKKGIDIHKSKLKTETVAGKEYWFFEVSPKPMKEDLYLLPNYDEYTIAFKERELFYPDPSIEMPKVGLATVFAHTIVHKGRIIGMYRREIKKDIVQIIPQLFKKPSQEEKELLQKAGEKYEKFLDKKITLLF